MPEANSDQRKLIASMFTDMVGYRALAQRNEALALEPVSQGRSNEKSVPHGRPEIAQRFIAGCKGQNASSSAGRQNI